MAAENIPDHPELITDGRMQPTVREMLNSGTIIRGNKMDLTGQRFGMLTVVEKLSDVHRPDRQVVWRCRCDCGAFKDAVTSRLRSGNTKSCGCSRSRHRSDGPRAPRSSRSPKDADWMCALTISVYHSDLPKLCRFLQHAGLRGGGGASRKMRLPKGKLKYEEEKKHDAEHVADR